VASLTVWKFETADGADQALAKLQGLVKQQLLTINDAAVVSWPQGNKKPKTRQVASVAAAGALSGAFWGMLFGLLFFIPFLGLAMGAAMGALMGHFTDYGISDEFIGEVRSQVVEGTSALFLLTDQVTIDKVSAAFQGTKMTLIRSNLSAEQEAALKQAFGQE